MNKLIKIAVAAIVVIIIAIVSYIFYIIYPDFLSAEQRYQKWEKCLDRLEKKYHGNVRKHRYDTCARYRPDPISDDFGLTDL